ncbi:hypothetical protein [Nocardia gamkensis]|uniref:hypothetical protein n=1 Tax=Nocardia gamkensis TaxID=352869 RepID=UPI0037C97692
MAIVSGTNPPCLSVGARSTTRQDTTEPVPDEGTRASSPDPQDEHPDAIGASSLSHRTQR